MKDYADKKWLKPSPPDRYEWAMAALFGLIYAAMTFLELSA